MRQAWLIIAHNEFSVLQRLITLLDAPDSDFYVHFDRKLKDLPELRVEKGRLSVLTDRIDVRWGTVSQIRVELLLMKTALSGGPYAHYHILSGTHLPLKTREELVSFYDAHAGEEIMRFWEEDKGDADFKIRRYHFPVRNLKSPRTALRKLSQWMWTAVLKVQKTLGIRHYTAEEFRKTDQWLSLTEKACRYLVGHTEYLLHKYKWAFCPDEYFIASELMKDPGTFTIYDCPGLLHVEFVHESPKVFSLGDYARLQETGCFWARKFTA